METRAAEEIGVSDPEKRYIRVHRRDDGVVRVTLSQLGNPGINIEFNARNAKIIGEAIAGGSVGSRWFYVEKDFKDPEDVRLVERSEDAA